MPLDTRKVLGALMLLLGQSRKILSRATEMAQMLMNYFK